jgi:hypothetical protein
MWGWLCILDVCPWPPSFPLILRSFLEMTSETLSMLAYLLSVSSSVHTTPCFFMNRVMRPSLDTDHKIAIFSHYVTNSAHFSFIKNYCLLQNCVDGEEVKCTFAPLELLSLLAVSPPLTNIHTSTSFTRLPWLRTAFPTFSST